MTHCGSTLGTRAGTLAGLQLAIGDQEARAPAASNPRGFGFVRGPCVGAAWVLDSRGDGRDSEWTGKGRGKLTKTTSLGEIGFVHA